MDEYGQLRALLDLAESLGIEIRRVPSAVGEQGVERHAGGALVELKGREILFLDPDSPVADRIAVAAGALAGRSELEATYLPPEIRQLIEGTGAAGRPRRPEAGPLPPRIRSLP